MFASAISLLLFVHGSLAGQSPQDMRAVNRVDCPGRTVLPMLDGPGQAPLIELEIAGKKYKFALDTGSGSGGRVPEEIVSRLHLDVIGIARAGDPSGRNSRDIKLYRIPEVKAGGATLNGLRVMAESDAGPNRSPSGFDGIIGATAFEGLLLTLDYPHRQVILDPRGMTRDEISRSLPYGLEHGLPILTITIGQVKVDGHVDSGSDGGLSIPAKFKDQLHLDGEPRIVGHLRTLFNETAIYSAKVKDPVAIGGMKLPIDQIEMHDLFPFGNIGGQVLRRYRITFDQKLKRILFET